MPFKETCPVEERIALFRDYETGVFTVSDLCRRHGISRETFYVWKRRIVCATWPVAPGKMSFPADGLEFPRAAVFHWNRLRGVRPPGA